jgi:hypothetical protein
MDSGHGRYEDRRSIRGGGWDFFDAMSRATLRLTQPPIQWVLGIISLGVKRLEREADQPFPSSTEAQECV